MIKQLKISGFFALITFALLFQTAAFAQNSFEVKGFVIDGKNESLPGATVMVKDEGTGVATDHTGHFTIKAPSSNSTLIVTFIGYDPVEVPINGRNFIEIILAESDIVLEEVSVIGYGTQKKAHLTGAVSSIRTDLFNDLPGSDISTMLQGVMPGLQIQNYTTDVGVAPEINIRGITSLSAQTGPLIIVDGAPMEDAFQMLNPQDIQSIDVLKDASSTAIYGSRGANGVIIITTKEGQVDKPTYDIRVYSTFKTPYKLREMMTMTEYVNLLQYQNELKGSGTVAPNYLAGAWLESQMGSTDWNKMLFKDTPMTHNVSVSLSGGKTGVKYRLSLDYINDQGITLQNTQDRFNFRTRTDIAISNKVSLITNILAVYRTYTRPGREYDSFAVYPTWLPVRHNEFSAQFTGMPVGSYAAGRHFNIPLDVYPIGPEDPETGLPTLVSANPYNTTGNNPMQVLESDFRRWHSYYVAPDLRLRAQLSSDLRFESFGKIIVSYTPYQRYITRNATLDGETNHGYANSTLYKFWMIENTLNYNKSFGEHNLELLGGFTAEKKAFERSYMHAVDFPTDYIHTLNAATDFVLRSTTGGLQTGTTEDSQSLASFLGRINYNFRERYLFSLAGRADGSSLLGIGNKWGFFPSLSVGWIVSEETFLKNQNWLSQLKLRASAGVSGNNAIENYATVDLLSTTMYPLGESQGTINSGLANNSSTLANKALRWEQTDELNLGLDFSVFRNKLSLTLDTYHTTTQALLFKRPIQSFTGFEDSWNNIGKIENKGFEASLTYNYNNKGLRWTSTLNFSTNKNRILQLGGEDHIIHKGTLNELYINKVGGPISQFYGYKTDGVWLNQEEINNNPHFTTGIDRPGSLKVMDINGDGVINENDYTILGDPYPDFIIGFNNQFNYKGFDLSLLFDGVIGSKINNGNAARPDYYDRDPKFQTKDRYISPEFPGDGKTPIRNGVQMILTDYLIENNSYVALRNVTFGYSFPRNTLQQFKINRLRLYVSGNNVLYFWSKNYRGLNPESLQRGGIYSSPLVAGFQRVSSPVVSSGTVGLNITF